MFDQMRISTGTSNTSLVEQTASLVKNFGENERQKILKKANISAVEITPEEMAALKANMGIPWEKLKTMSRYKQQI